MRSLFFRLYLLLTVAIVGLGWSIDQFIDSYDKQASLTTDLDIHKGTLFLLNKELKRQQEGERLAYLNAVSSSFGYPVSLINQEQLGTQAWQNLQMNEEQQHYLNMGGIVTLFNDIEGTSWFIQKLSDSHQVIVLGPIINGTASQPTAIYTMVFFGGLAFVVFLWVWPISRSLMSLTKAATAFGKGDFSVRATTDISRPLHELIVRFNAMADRIQRLIKSHKELSHAVSHELRTPIARIRFAMEMVRDVKEESARQKYLDTMDENIEELDSLVDELLTYARFDREDPKLTIEQHNLVNVINNIVDKFRAPNANLRFSVLCSDEGRITDKNLSILCDFDKDAITRIVDNLIRNAVRYANQDVQVVILDEQQHVSVHINDDGAGIPEENWNNLFDPFVRLDQSRDRTSGGIGLGLAIVKRYIELHKGNVSIGKSEIGGASFKLQWPKQLQN
ncbi:hypothetical protein KIH87_17330 [Paraneptunicella aestuarii]|uniref:ATP-binding protein n=1 Tax=Paraneptunicella aestuarii TaxID=2831148 RepID=UPI001E5693FB|nr:ATP-binding protein [Paraneptunicella aestuarii]UAA38420.1 hypothetical protein KIH87_17330 [Paraneptunicella aestuarii]